jgi:heterotetrameric sarcosine oxidase delta subunit
MLIKCPYCGARPSEEFTYMGDASVKRPKSNDPSSMEEWFAYVYLRDNVKGRMKEHWHHSGGCRSWLVVERDTQTHEIFSTAAARETGRR